MGGLLVALAVAAAVTSRATTVRERLIETLSEKLDSDVELSALSVRTFPLVAITGEKLVVRKRGTSGPPLIAVRRFTVEGGLIGFLSRPRRFNVVHLDGLEITIAPRQDGRKEANDDPGDRARDDRHDSAHVYIRRVLSHDARLVIIPRRAGKAPRVFAIHDLALDDAGFDRAMPFHALLTNPLPRGTIDVKGTFGPWHARRPGATPLGGKFDFHNADLSTVKGIGGTLSADGAFSGTLERIKVAGATDTPDFSVDVGGGTVPLRTRFDATVDGTDGDTYLHRVDAAFRRTSLVARGAITGTPGVKGRAVQLDVRMDRGRIEDVLRLAVGAPEALMTGDMEMTASLLLPQGAAPVSDRLQLTGTFALSRGAFEDGAVQRKLVALSRRGRGMNEEAPATGEVVSNLRGNFRLAHGVIDFANLAFGVPGADVRIKGRYGLRTQGLDFLGHLRMRATVSQAMGGGVKGLLLKPFDPLFRRDGAGAVVPLKIGGTREAPKVGLDYGRVFTRQ